MFFFLIEIRINYKTCNQKFNYEEFDILFKVLLKRKTLLIQKFI